MTGALRLKNRAVHAAWRWIQLYGAVAPGTDQGDRFGTLGEGSCIAFPQATLFGTESIHIGAGALIGRHCSLSVGYTPWDARRPERGLVIGERSVIGARAVIQAHEQVTIGDDVWFGQDVFISDASHGYQDPDEPIGKQYGPHQPISIGSGSWIGHGSIILPGTQLGRNVVVAAGSVVRGSFGDHAVIGGVPAKPLRSYEPGTGWHSVSGSGEVKPIWRTADMHALLDELDQLDER